MIQLSSFVLLFAAWSGVAHATQIQSKDYPFPYNEPLLPSVTFALIRPAVDSLQVRTLSLKPERKKVAVLGEFADFRYGVYVQKGKDVRNAPVILYLSGIGGTFQGGGNKFITQSLYESGFNVISIDSNFFFTRILSLSRDGYPGYLPDDAEDLYPILHQILEDFRKTYQTGFGDVHIMGLSMGALESAHISRMDREKKLLGIKKTVMLNPPASLRYALKVLDAFYAVGDNWSYEYKQRVMGYVIDTALNNIDNPNAIMSLNKILKLGEPQVQYLIGKSFRETLRDAIVTSQQIDDRGILKGPYTELLRNERTEEANAFSFAQYVEEFLYPIVLKRHPAETSQLQSSRDLFARADMTDLEPYMRENPNLYVITNADDMVLRSTDPAYLEDILKERLILFPFGGHCGNVWHPLNQAQLIKVLKN
ncbi:hypothetical protein K2X30_04140 [bacterium]|nr:hypothetical protein [bacterium]